MRQFGVAVPGGVEHVGRRARTLHQTGNWLVITDFSNAFNTVNKTAVLVEVVNCVPALTPFVVKRYGTRPTDVFFRTDSGEGHRTRSFGWTREKLERSLAPVMSNKETQWGRQCSVLLCDQG